MRNAILLPLIAGIVLAVVLCIFFNSNVERVLPVPEGTAFAFHDTLSNENNVDLNNLKNNDSIGYLELDETKLGIRYEADYSSLVGSVSLKKESTALDEIGCAYLKTTKENAKLIEKSKSISVDTAYGSFKYELVNELEFDNEYQATIYAPSIAKSLVVYYQNSNGAGLTSKYNALVFKEV